MRAGSNALPSSRRLSVRIACPPLRGSYKSLVWLRSPIVVPTRHFPSYLSDRLEPPVREDFGLVRLDQQDALLAPTNSVPDAFDKGWSIVVRRLIQ